MPKFVVTLCPNFSPVLFHFFPDNWHIFVLDWNRHEGQKETTLIYSLIVADVTASILVERTIAKKSFGKLTL